MSNESIIGTASATAPVVRIAPDVKLLGNADDAEYAGFLSRLQKRFAALAEAGPLFTTDTSELWSLYLSAFPESERQFHNCNACRHFIERFGGLVVIWPDGLQRSALWDATEADPPQLAAIDKLERAARRAKVTGVFLSSESVLGVGETGVWRHLRLAHGPVFKHALLSAGQAMAVKREDFATVARALGEFTLPVLEQAVQLLKTDALYRSEKVLGQAEWLRDLQLAREATSGIARDNVLWLAVAKAPDGFCHPRSSMIGTLLEDLAAGLPFSDVARKFAAKMSPLQYQRPQAAPSAGNIEQAEKIVERLGLANSLKRRFARLEELQTIWAPAAPAAPKFVGVFGHLKPKGDQAPSALAVPAQKITWEKFRRTALADAERIDVKVAALDNFCALLTAEDASAPPILQWDTLEQRNPVSWYVYSKVSPASRWLLSTGWVKVNAVSDQPSSWFGSKLEHQGESVVFVLDGARDTGFANAGLGLFPETLKSELREVRATIEAFSRKGELTGAEEATACGLRFQKGDSAASVHVRVTTRGDVIAEYVIDRWD